MTSKPSHFIIFQFDGCNVPGGQTSEEDATVVNVTAKNWLLKEHFPSFLNFKVVPLLDNIVSDASIPGCSDEAIVTVGVPNEVTNGI